MAAHRRFLALAIALLVVASVSAAAIRVGREAPAIGVAAAGAPASTTPAPAATPEAPSEPPSEPASVSTTAAERTTLAAGLPERRVPAAARDVPTPTIPPTTIPPVTIPPLPVDRPDTLAVTISRKGEDARNLGGIAEMDSDGDIRRVLTTERAYHPQWSPGGEYVVATVERGEHPIEVYIVAIPRDGGPALTLRRGNLPMLSPDGHKLLYEPYPPTRSLRIARVEWGEQPRLVEDGAASVPSDGTYRWSPDSRALSFVKRSETSSDLWRINADGSGMRQLTSSGNLRGENGWSPDGRIIAFVVDVPTGGTRTYLMDSDGGDPRPALDPYPAGDWGFAWAHGANALVLVTEGGMSLKVVDVRGHIINEVRPKANMFPMRPPVWSADDHRLYYLAMPRDHFEPDPNLYDIRIADGTERQLTTDHSVLEMPAVLTGLTQ